MTNAFSPTLYTAGPSFTPACVSPNISASGVTTAATAYDWFSLINGGSGAYLTQYSAMSTSTATGVQNKAYLGTIANEARAALLPIVKAEAFVTAIAPLVTTITDLSESASNSLTTIATSVDAATKTALAAAYAAEAAVIAAALTRIKTLENKIYVVGDSIDVTTGAATTGVLAAYAATANLSSLTGAKIFLSNMFDPAYLGNAGTAVPSLTASTFANSATLLTIYNNANTALAATTTLTQLKALNEMSAQAIFDLYCMEAQGYASSGTTGSWASGSAPVGIVPGIDYTLHMTGTMQTGTASAGTPGAPSVVTAFW